MVFQKTSPSSILLIKLRHHGDVLLSTPVARTLKTFFPASSIDFLVYEGTDVLLKNNPDVRHVWIWYRSTVQRWQKIWKIVQLFFHLRRQHYDLVIHLSDQMQGALLAKFLGPRESIGIDYPKRRHFLWHSCFSKLTPFFPSNTHHTIEQNIATLAFLKRGQPGSLSFFEVDSNTNGLASKMTNYRADPFLGIAEEDRCFVKDALCKKNITTPYLLIHPTARWFFKCWEENRFAAVIQYFADRGWPILLTSGPEQKERAMVAKILQKVNSLFVHSLAGQLTLGQLAAAIEGARLFVGVDSVPMHMAAALKKDVVALWGPSKINEWYPWKTRCRLVKASDYGSVIDPDRVKTGTNERYLSNIPVTAVISSMEELLCDSCDDDEVMSDIISIK